MNNNYLNSQKKNSPEKQSSSVLLKILKNEETNESRLKTKCISRINFDINKSKK